MPSQQTLAEFVRDWNETHSNFRFTLIGAESPVSVEIRYTAVRYKDKTNGIEKWERFTGSVDYRGRGTVFAATGYDMFEQGIIELKLANLNHNYEDFRVISILRWAGEEFFCADSTAENNQ